MAAASAGGVIVRVLVLDGHSRAALETLQSLGRAGAEIDVAAEHQDCLAFHSRYARRKLRQPLQERVADFHEWLRSQEGERNYELIVPATEASLLGLRALDEDDPLRRKAVLPGDHALDITLDKEKTWSLARTLGVPAPESRLISALVEIGDARLFPLVLKPTRSKVMINGELCTLAAAIIKDEAQRQQQLRQWLPLTPVLEQQYVSGRGVGAEFLFRHGQKIWHFVHERVHEYPLTGGASSYRRAIDPPRALLRDAEALLTALNWHGVAMVEFKVDAGGKHWLMEINPRLWGSLALSIYAGMDFPRGLLQIARGETPAAQPNYKLVRARDLRTDMEWLKANLRADHRDPLLLTKSRFLSFIELFRPLIGEESWDHFDWHDLGITRRILSSAVYEQLHPVVRRIKNWYTRRWWLGRHRSVLKRVAESGRPGKILFLCYGNICRSPLAAALARQSLPSIEIESAGFHGQEGRRCPEKMLRVAQLLGVDLSQHRSARATREQLLSADLVIAMDLENIERLKAQCPEALSRSTLLGLFAESGTVQIADPYAADEAMTRKISEQVRAGISGLICCFPSAQTANCLAEVPTVAESVRL
jgi:protein-tyrosine-phosphatase/predicted ATP-grasp superfamily ATP-dependent carboligase